MNVVGQANVIESRIDLTTATDGNYIVNSGMTINDIDYGVNEITSVVGPQNLNANPYEDDSLIALGNTPESSRANQMNGAIAEYIVFPTILSESDRRKITRYLIYTWVV